MRPYVTVRFSEVKFKITKTVLDFLSHLIFHYALHSIYKMSSSLASSDLLISWPSSPLDDKEA